MGETRGFVAVTATVLMLLSVLPAAGSEPSTDSIELPAVPDVKPDDAVASSTLKQLIDDLAEGTAPDPSLEIEGRRVRVEVLHDLSPEAFESVVTGLGGVVEGSLDGVAQALMPVAQLETLEADDDVEFVRPPLRVDLELAPAEPARLLDVDLAVTGQHVSKTRAGAWHAEGIVGDGVKIGIIDGFGESLWNAAQAAGDLPEPAGTFWCVNLSCGTSFPDSGSSHGVAVAEVIHDMAPAAELYLATAVNTFDLQEVVDYFDSQGVDIISRSQTSYYDGPGNGTGQVADVVDDAVSKGMLWVNAAGNSAGRTGVRPGSYWRGQWADANANGWLDFAPGSELIEVSGCGLLNGLRWSDWGQNRTDYDFYVFDTVQDAIDFNWKARSFDNQSTGAPPLEIITSQWCSQSSETNYLAVNLFAPGAGTSGDVLEILGNRLFFSRWNNPYSAAGPASDSASPGMLAVGAIDPPLGNEIAPYSSRGPTNDGRVKPDLSAASCVSTFTQSCFNGTSAATPVVSGAAALVISSGLATSPTAVRSYLLDNATVDRGQAGSDNTFGRGELVLPNPPAISKPPTWPDATFRADVFERTVTLEWKAARHDQGVAGYLIYQAPGQSVNGVYHGNLVADVGGSARSHPVGDLVPGTSYAFWVEAYDAAGNVSRDGPLRVFTTAADFADTNGHAFHDDIAWLSGSGITRGCNPPDNDRFCPDQPVTRGQMASFLMRALELSGGTGSDFFVDDDHSVHEPDIDRLAFWEITQGCNPNAVPSNTRFCPDDPVTRAQMASFLVRALGLSDGWDVDRFHDDDFSVHEFDINRLAHSRITLGCNPPTNTLYCPDQPVTRGQMAAFIRRAADEFNVIRGIVEIPLLGEKDVGDG